MKDLCHIIMTVENCFAYGQVIVFSQASCRAIVLNIASATRTGIHKRVRATETHNLREQLTVRITFYIALAALPTTHHVILSN